MIANQDTLTTVPEVLGLPPEFADDEASKLDPLQSGRESKPSRDLVADLPVREVRVAATMVGGSALCIYENGVTQEFFSMVQGQGVYGLLKRLTHSHAYIDILSGTSAGGINSVYLAASLAMKRDVWPTRNSWITLGGIDDLLQDPQDRSVASLLRGNEYFLPELERAMQLIWENKPLLTDRSLPSGQDTELPEHYGDLDLFVTGTYLRAQPQTFFDQRNQPIFGQNFKGVFHLKHRAWRGESHFHPELMEPQSSPAGTASPDPDHGQPEAPPGNEKRLLGITQRLGRIARTTASLPAIFEPSAVRPSLMGGVISLPIAWKTTYMGDGGYLNNRPLDLVLREVLRRPMRREVQRKLFFVEPVAGERLDQPSEEPLEPTAIQHLALFEAIRGTQSLTDALNQVYEHNVRSQRVTDALESAREAVYGEFDLPAGEIELEGSPGPVSPVSPVRPAGHRFRTAQHDLWIELRLQELRDLVVEEWRKRRGLAGFEAVSNANQAQLLADRERQCREAESLRVIRTRLLQMLEWLCEDWTGVARRRRSEAARKAFAERVGLQVPPPTFHLDKYDVGFMVRKVRRAETEIYRLLHPVVDHGADGTSRRPSAQQARGEQYLRLGWESYRHVRDLLPELHRRRNRMEILEENVACAIGAIAGTAEYAAAAAAALEDPDGSALDRSIAALWNLLAECVIQLVGVSGAKGETGPPEGSDYETKLRNDLGALSGKLCAVLEANPKEPTDRAQLAMVGNAHPTTILEQTSEEVDQILYRVVTRVNPPMPPAAGARKVGVGPVPLAAPAASMAWAVRAVADAGGRDPRARLALGMQRLDMFTFPMERAAGMPAQEAIELIYVSAANIKSGLSDRPPDDKLAGDSVANLGGFLKRSWRANDILWGRLDGSGAIVETLLDRERLDRVLLAVRSDCNTAARLLAALDLYVLRGDPLGDLYLRHGFDPTPEADDDLGRYLRPRYEADRKVIWRWLTAGVARGSTAAAADGFRKLREWLLLRHQLEILCQEMPSALAEATSEHGEWQGTGQAEGFLAQLTGPPPILAAASDAASKEVKAAEREADRADQKAGQARREAEEARKEVERFRRSAELKRLAAERARQDAAQKTEKVRRLKQSASGAGAGAAPSPPASGGFVSAPALVVAALNRQVADLSVLSGSGLDRPVRQTLRLKALGWIEVLFTGSNGSPRPEDTVAAAVDCFFRERYAVGKEEPLHDIPPLVTAQRVSALIAVALRVLQNSLPESFTKSGPGKLVQRALLAPLSLIAVAFDAFLRALVQGKAAIAAAHAGAWTAVFLGVAALLMGTQPVGLLVVLVLLALGVETGAWALAYGGQAIGRTFTGIGTLALAALLLRAGLVRIGAVGVGAAARTAPWVGWVWWGGVVALVLGLLLLAADWLTKRQAGH